MWSSARALSNASLVGERSVVAVAAALLLYSDRSHIAVVLCQIDSLD